MPDSSSVKKLLNITQKKNDSSAKKLGELNFQYQEAEKKLNLLLQYRQSYQVRLQNASQNGMDHIEWTNFITFINKLNTAICEQRLVVEQAENSRDLGGIEYQSHQRELKSYEALSRRYQKRMNLKQSKLEQKEYDEFASNRFARHVSNTTK